MKEAVRRAVRTFFQTFLGVVIVQGGFTFTEADFAIAKAAVVAGVTAVVVLAHNLLEDRVPQIDTRS